jgi:hypothetical protein
MARNGDVWIVQNPWDLLFPQMLRFKFEILDETKH